MEMNSNTEHVNTMERLSSERLRKEAEKSDEMITFLDPLQDAMNEIEICMGVHFCTERVPILFRQIVESLKDNRFTDDNSQANAHTNDATAYDQVNDNKAYDHNGDDDGYVWQPTTMDHLGMP